MSEEKANKTSDKSEDKLRRYRKKRDFGGTIEPYGSDSKIPEKVSIFVVQKHNARKLHYDFRLESNGVLKSWAIPKGPSANPKVKRLAIPTEDHPIEYGSFEGVIPEGHYGAGTVMVWDTGFYRNLTEKGGKKISIEEGVKMGHVSVWLEGKKLKGGYALTRFRIGKNESWLLVKMNDEYARTISEDNLLEKETKSALSGKSMDEIAREGRNFMKK